MASPHGPPIVVFTLIPLNELHVQHMVRVSRLVAQWNGNRVGRRKIHLITDNFTLARETLTAHDQQHNAKSALATGNAGLFWPDSGVTWVRPNEIRVGQNIRTLAHETAHAIVPGDHPRTWRRMYALLLPLWWKAFRPHDDVGLNLRFEITHVTRRYTGKRMSADRQQAEVDAHVKASVRTYDRWEHLVIN